MSNKTSKFRDFLNKRNQPEQINNKEKFFLALPNMPLSLSNSLIHMAYIKFYTDMIGLDVKFVGLLYLVFGIWNAINDPMMGVFIDRFKYTKKRGKFAYLMRVTTPITVLASLLMVFAQPGWQDWVIFAFMLVLLFIFDTTQTIYSISYTSYIYIAAPTKEERVDVSVYSTYIAHLGNLLGSIIPTFLLVGESNRSLTVILFCVILIVNSVLYYIALRPLKDRPEMYQAEFSSEEGTLARQLRENVKDIVRSKAFITFVLYQVVGRGSFAINFTTFLYIADYVLKLNGTQATILDIVPGALLFLVVPLLGKLTKRLGLKRTAIYGSIPMALSYLSLYFVQNIWQAFIIYTMINISATMTGLMLRPMLGAIIDEDEQKTGVRKAGVYTGLNALLTIPVSGLHTMLFTTILGVYEFASGVETQTELAQEGIRIGAGIIPFGLILVGILPMVLSPITKAKEKALSEFSESQHRMSEPDEIDGIAEPVTA